MGDHEWSTGRTLRVREETGLVLEYNPRAKTVRVHHGWLGPNNPRTPPPPMPADLLPKADQAARGLLEAEAGALLREQEGTAYVYRFPGTQTHRV